MDSVFTLLFWSQTKRTLDFISRPVKSTAAGMSLNCLIYSLTSLLSWLIENKGAFPQLEFPSAKPVVHYTHTRTVYMAVKEVNEEESLSLCKCGSLVCVYGLSCSVGLCGHWSGLNHSQSWSGLLHW